MKLLDKIKKNYSRLERRDFLFAYLIILIPVAQFLVFWVYVNASSIAFAFQDRMGDFTWGHFKTVQQSFTEDGILWDALVRSFTLWIVGEGIIFPVTLITTYVLTRKIAGHYIFRVIYYIPSLMGTIIWTLLISDMVTNTGPITKMLSSLDVIPTRAARQGLLRYKDTAFITLLTVRSIMGIVGNNAVLTGAYTRVPNELFESAELDGAGFFAQMFKIAIPCIWATVCTLLTFALCSIFTCDYNVWLFMGENGGYDTETIGFHIFNETYKISMRGGNADYGYPAALGVVLTLFTLPVVLLGKWGLEKMSENVEV